MLNINSKDSKTRKALTAVTRELQYNEKAAARYMKKANQSGVSDKYINLVKNGKIGSSKDIQNITSDSSLQKKIEKYKTYYEKAQNCQTATADLASTIQSLSESLANIPIEKAEKKIEKLEKSSSLARARAETKTSAVEKNRQIDIEIKNLGKSTKEKEKAADSSKKNLEKGAAKALKENYKGLSAKDRKKIKDQIKSRKPISDALLEKVRKQGSASLYSKLTQYNKFLDSNDTAQCNYNLADAENTKTIREDNAEQHQNLADEYQSTLDKYSAQKELATTAAGKNSFIDSQKATTEALYNEKIAIADLEGNSNEAEQLKAEKTKALLDLEVERHQNLADEYQSSLDLYSAQKDNVKTAAEKNSIVDMEKEKTRQLYAEKMAIAGLEGNINEQLQLQEELNRHLVVLEKEKFDNIAHQYENQRRLVENSYQNLSNAADELEARGLIVSASLYSSQIDLNNAKKAGYEEELRLLEQQLPNIEQGSEEWYDALDAIQACKDGISDTTQSTIELNKSIREIPWLLNEKISSRFQVLSSEYDLMIKYMSNKKMTDEHTGNFTKEGTATLAAYYSQLLLAQRETENAKQALEDMLASIESGKEGYEYTERSMEEYYEKYQEYIDLAGTEFDIQQNLIEFMKDKYQAELDYLQDIIDKRKELLQAEKDAYDYQRTIEEKTGNVSTLAKQLQALDGDDSEAARTRRQQLQVSLDEAKKDLQDTEYNQWISDQQEMLDNLYNEYSDFIGDHMNDTDALLQEAIDYLKSPEAQETFRTVMEDYAKNYGFKPESDFDSILSALGKGSDLVNAVEAVGDVITSYYNKQQEDQQKADEFTSQISSINFSDIDSNYDTLKNVKELYSQYGNLDSSVKNKMDSSTKVSLEDYYRKAQDIETNASHAQNAINAIGNVTLDSTQAIQNANGWFNSLTESGRQIVRDKGLEQVLISANQTYANLVEAERQQEERKERLRQNLDYYIKSTYGADGATYATNISNASASEINIANAIKRRNLNRGDGINSPNDAAISQIVSWINNSGYGINISPTADALWQYMQNIGYSSGGIADTLQKTPRLNGDDGWVTLKKGEGVLTPEQTRQFQKLAENLDVLNPAVKLVSYLSNPDLSTVPNSMVNQSVRDIQINMSLPGVTNYEEFRQQMQSDPKIEKMLKSMIWDRGDFSKYNISM